MVKTQIEISGSLEFVSILSLNIKIQANEHGRMKASGILTQEAFKRCQTNTFIWKNITVKTIHGEVLFYGIITKLEFGTDRNLRYIEIECSTESLLFDLQPHKRIFQDIRMTYGQLLSCILSDGRRVGAGSCKTAGIKNPVIQYDETDWQFIKRIGGSIQTVVLSGYTDSQSTVFLGIPKVKTEQNPFELDFIQNIEITKLYMLQTQDGGFKLPEYGCFERWNFSHEENLELGDWVIRKGIRAQIFRKKITLVKGILLMEYEAGPAIYCSPANLKNNHLKGVVIEGTVLSTDKEFIKMQFDMDALTDIGESQAYPFPYMPESGNVFYSMPEPGTRVCVYFPDYYEGHGCVIHGKRESLEEYPDSDVKEFRSFKDKVLRMDPGSVEIEGQGDSGANAISLSGHKGMDIQSNEEIHIKAKDDIKIYSGRFCTVTSEHSMLLNQSRTENSIEMSGNDMFFSAEQYSSASCMRQGKKTNIGKEKDEISCGAILDFLAGGIPSSGGNVYEQAVLGGLPISVSNAESRDIQSVLGKRIAR